MKNASQKVKTDEFWQRALFAICTRITTLPLHSCYDFAFVLRKKCIRFQPIRLAKFFFTYVITWITYSNLEYLYFHERQTMA